MGFLDSFLKYIDLGQTEGDNNGDGARDGGKKINDNIQLIDNALEEINDASEKSVNKAENLDNPNQTNFPTTQATKTGDDNTLTAAQGYTDDQLANYQPTSEKGQPDGYAPLDTNGKVPIANTYGALEEIIEGTYVDSTTFNDELGDPVTPGTAKIYLDTTTGNANSGKQFRWAGSQFTKITDSPGTTDEVAEGTSNLYFTVSRVRAVALTGLSIVSGFAINSGDTILSAFGKLQGQINSLITSLGNKLEKDGYTGTAATLKSLIDTKQTATQVQALIDQSETTALDKRGSNLASDLSTAEQDAWKTKLGITDSGGSGINIIDESTFDGVFDLSDGNYRYYDLYESGSALETLSISATKALGSQAIVDIKGDFIADVNNFIPASWRFSGDPISGEPSKINEVRTELLKSNIVAVVNRVFDYPDTEDPTAPTNLSSSNTTGTATTLSWDASSDNVQVASYKVYKDGVFEKNVLTGTSTTITGLSNTTTYDFHITAIDSSGNESAASSAIQVTTLTATEPIDWQYEANTTDLGGGTLDLNAGAIGNFSNGAYATKAFNGDNAVSFTAPTTGTVAGVMGLNTVFRAISNQLNAPDIMVLFNQNTNQLSVNYMGSQVYNSSAWTAGSRLTVRLTGTTVSFEKDGVAFYTSPETFNTPLTPIGMMHGNFPDSQLIACEFENINNIELSNL